MNSLLLARGDNIKSIPLSSLPEDSWQYVVGGVDFNISSLLDLIEDVPWLARGITARCNALSNLPFAIHQGDEDGEEISKADWPFRLNIPQLMFVLYQDYIVFGRAYGFINKNKLNTPIPNTDYMRRWLPTSIKPVYDANEGIVAFKRTIEGMALPLFPVEDVIYWHKPSLRDETGYGKSDAMNALKASGVLDNLDTYVGKFFKQGAVNTTLISVEGSIQEPDKDRIQSWVERRVQGIKNAFMTRVIGGKLSSVTLGYAVKDLAAKELTDSKREDIATALGVPQSILFSNASNYATAKQDDLHLYDKTVLPDARVLEDLVNEKAFMPLGYTLKFHPERMELYQQSEADKAQSVATLKREKIITVGEARNEMGYDGEVVPPEIGDNVSDGSGHDEQIFEYHITTGTVLKNEVRERLGLPPLTDDNDNRMRELQSQFALINQAIETGMTLEQAAALVGLDLPSTPKQANSQQQATNDNTNPPPQPNEAPAKSIVDALHKWERMANKRYAEGHPAKALDFENSDLPPTLAGAVRGALRHSQTVEDMSRVFENALQFRGYP